MEYNITYRKKDGGWQYIISTKEDGKWKYKTSKQGFRTRGLAKIAADDRLEELKKEHTLQLNTEYKGITLKEYYKMFVEHEKMYKEPGTIRLYGYAVKKFKKLYDKELSAITTLDIQGCVDDMVKGGLHPNTINIYVKKAKTMFNKAIKPYNIINENPVSDLVIPIDKEGKRVKALTVREFEDLLSKIKNKKYYLISLIAGTCGLRIGEILGLTWDNIDFQQSILTVEKQWKRSKGGEWGFGTTKSKNSNRTIPIPPKTLKKLKIYKREAPTDILNRVILYTAISNISRELRMLYKKLGYDISVHDLRHTYATTLIANGVDFKTVAKLMGHDVKETLTTYSHVTDDMFDNAANTVNNIFK